MSVDYPSAIDYMLPLSYSFNSVNPLAIVQHSTGGDLTIEDVHNTFLATMRSTHFAIGRDGRVAQFVPLNRGAGGNCCADNTHDSFWDSMINTYGNLNMCTISIEHCNDGSQSLTMTPEQMDASNKLTLWLCQKFNIPSSHIKGHDSINATNCPGSVFYNTYWQQMLDYVKNGGSQVTSAALAQQFEDVWFSGGSYCGETGIKAIVKEACLAGKLPAVFPLQHTGPNANSHGELKTVTLWTTAPVLKQCLSNGDYVEYTAQETRIYSNRGIRIL